MCTERECIDFEIWSDTCEQSWVPKNVYILIKVDELSTVHILSEKAFVWHIRWQFSSLPDIHFLRSRVRNGYHKYSTIRKSAGRSSGEQCRLVRISDLDDTLWISFSGGFTWAIDDLQRLRRFLCLGSEGGTYYQGKGELDKPLFVRKWTLMFCLQARKSWGLRMLKRYWHWLPLAAALKWWKRSKRIPLKAERRNRTQSCSLWLSVPNQKTCQPNELVMQHSQRSAVFPRICSCMFVLSFTRHSHSLFV